MGGLFSSMDKKSLPEIYVDIQNAQPSTEQEHALYNEFQSEVMDPSIDIFRRFSEYQDGQRQAAEALTNPTPENKEAAWKAIYPNIKLQMEVFDFANVVSRMLVHLVTTVIDLTHDKTIDVFQSMPIVVKFFVECFDIILTFDEIKITLPKLLNDLAFFRRNAANHTDEDLDGIMEKSNGSTVFWAAPTPLLLEAIGNLKSKYQPTSENYQKLLDLLGNVCDICTSILKNHKFEDEKPNKLCLRCIVGATLMYDHLSTTGAFIPKQKFHIREAMELLVNFEPKQNGLINAIKFSSKNLNKEGVDPKISALFQ